MRKYLNLCAFFCVAFLACPVLCAQENSPQPFADGDRVCFIGGSITHAGLYQSYIRLFYATRYPERKVEMYNCGISGDSASGALKRMDWDILVHKPTIAAIMLGMNDVNRQLYGKDNPGEDMLQKRQNSLTAYASNMRALAQKLKESGCCKIIFITPSIYDQTAKLPEQNLFGVAAGGKGNFYESNGFGHGFWNDLYRKPETTAQMLGQKRVTNPAEFQYTALDGMARKAYGAEIVNWGPASGKASFKVNLGKDPIEIELDNVGVLKLDLQSTALGSRKEFTFSVNSAAAPQQLPAGTKTAYLVRTDKGYTVNGKAPESAQSRPHFPGGLNALLTGEPVLIVYGTAGNDEMRAAMKQSAGYAAQSVNARWNTEKQERVTKITPRTIGRAYISRATVLTLAASR